MQRYLCILGLAGTNKVIPVEQPLRHLRHPVGEYVSLRLGCDKPGRPLRAREEGFGRIEHVSGDPGAIRTRDPQIRNLMLYPAELRGHKTQWQWRSPPESAPRRETYVSRRVPAISGEQRSPGQPLPRRANGPKYLAVRSKVDIDSIHRSRACPDRGSSGSAGAGGAMSMRGRGKCVYS